MKKALFLLISLFILGAFGISEAAYTSQCLDGQNNCTHKNDEDILRSQCQPVYGMTFCDSMQAYLNQMANDCNYFKPEGVECNVIPSGGFYGQEASEFAAYLERNPEAVSKIKLGLSAPGSAAGSGTGDLVYPTEFGLPDPAGGVKGVLARILDWLLMLVGIVAMIAFVISGFQYFLAAGDEGQATVAKRNMTYSILGVIAALSGLIVIRAVDAALRASSIF